MFAPMPKASSQHRDGRKPLVLREHPRAEPHVLDNSFQHNEPPRLATHLPHPGLIPELAPRGT